MNNFVRFIEIDGNPLGERPSNLDKSDKCVYALKYCGGKGVHYNSHILNIKKPINDPYVNHKKRSIQFLGKSMSTALNVKVVKENWSIVVIPPSKSKSDPLYDDRLLQILEHAGLSDVVVDIFFIEETREPSHTNQNVNNRSVEFHQNIIKYDKKLIPILKNNIIIFDDVITSGAQYKAVKNILLDINPDYNIRGMFIARTLCD